MALYKEVIRLLARLTRERGLSGTCVTFGVQSIGGNYAQVARLLEAEGYPYRSLTEAEVKIDPLPGRGDRIHQTTLFRMLGFETVHSIDISPTGDPTHRLDLTERMPEELHSQYDFVCDIGTIEHCLNPAQVLSNVVDLAKPGGHILHVTPISGWLRHGYYQICPNLFFHFYAENRFTDFAALIEVEGRCVDPRHYLPRRDFLGRKAVIVFLARKTADGPIRYPVQFEYGSEAIAQTVAPFASASGGGPRSGGSMRSLFDPRQWLRDAANLGKQYVRLALRGRRI